MIGMDQTTVTFLGTAAAIPSAGHDAASFVVNERYLVDTGWNTALTLLTHGLDPLNIEYLLLTHCHHDHYLGLPQLLFFTGPCNATGGPRTGAGHRSSKYWGRQAMWCTSWTVQFASFRQTASLRWTPQLRSSQ